MRFLERVFDVQLAHQHHGDHAERRGELDRPALHQGNQHAALDLLDGQRQWTKSQVGMPGLGSLPLEESICALILKKRPTVIDSGFRYVDVDDGAEYVCW